MIFFIELSVIGVIATWAIMEFHGRECNTSLYERFSSRANLRTSNT